ncbi:KAP family P-loop NTPase fold protein [Candidatus Palauibacter sp.]|uniref:KAP family P-loop NTPase fold protein n=1 Tax=Candidatus Palauibacter sp. TaxID=3101350 RepID=UPI003B01CAE4
MAFQIQPPDIEVPDRNPFQHDLLDRQQSIDALTSVVTSLEGPCVLAIDSAWGTGKTTFLRMWKQHLLNNGFSVIDFNAWETDFTGDPLLALSTDLLDSLQSLDTPSIADQIRRLSDAVPGLLRTVASPVISHFTHGLVDVNSLLQPSERIAQYRETVRTLSQFRTDLEAVAAAISAAQDEKPLLVMVDELDRCRPSYAVELLEVAKHLFAVRHVVFALAVNRSELEHSVKALYGDGFDAHGYLRRFFDIDFQLPDPDRSQFIDHMLEITGVNRRMQEAKVREDRPHVNDAREMLKGFLSLPQLGIRRIAQSIHRLGLIYASLPTARLSFLFSAAAALILRTLDLHLYARFVSGQLTAEEVISELSAKLDGDLFLQVPLRYVLEGILIVAANGREGKILQEYRERTEEPEPDDVEGRVRWEHARNVVSVVTELQGWEEWQLGFETAVARLEMFAETSD